MFRFVGLCFEMLVRLFCGRRSLLLENLALRQQLAVVPNENVVLPRTIHFFCEHLPKVADIGCGPQASRWAATHVSVVPLENSDLREKIEIMPFLRSLS